MWGSQGFGAALFDTEEEEKKPEKHGENRRSKADGVSRARGVAFNAEAQRRGGTRGFARGVELAFGCDPLGFAWFRGREHTRGLRRRENVSVIVSAGS